MHDNRYFYRLLVVTLSLLMFSVQAQADPVVWFDEAHAQAFKVGKQGDLQLSALGEVFQRADFRVEAGARELTPAFLKGKHALIISGPFKPLSPAEVTAVIEFVRQGGRLAVMLHIGPSLSGLLQALGVVHSNGVIHERVAVIGGEDINFRAAIAGEHPLTRGLSDIALYGSWALLAEGKDTEVLARTSDESWVDLNGNQNYDAGDAKQSFAVMVHGKLGKGAFVVFGDDAIFQNRFLAGSNLALARNLADWMRTGIPRGELVMLSAPGNGY